MYQLKVDVDKLNAVKMVVNTKICFNSSVEFFSFFASLSCDLRQENLHLNLKP